MQATAATAAKQQPRAAAPLPQPIPLALATSVQQPPRLQAELQRMRSRLSALEGTVLTQLHAQAAQLAAAHSSCSGGS
jgi:hypothetical protein